MNAPPARGQAPGGEPLGFFLTLEGIEGTGKSTHARFLAAALEEDGCRVVTTREPGGTVLGEELRRLLLGTEDEHPVPEAELFLLLAARAQHVQRLILPALNDGRVVICDRYGEASLAYQGGGRGLGVDRVAGANAIATGGLVPDLTLLLDVSDDELVRRIERRRRKTGDLDRMDRESLEFFRAVRGAYLDLAARSPERFLVLSTHEDKDTIAARILERVAPLVRRRRDAGGLR